MQTVYDAQMRHRGDRLPPPRTKKRFGEQRVHYEFVDIDMDADGLALVERVNNGKHVIPTLVFGDGSTQLEPSNAELAVELLGQTERR